MCTSVSIHECHEGLDDGWMWSDARAWRRELSNKKEEDRGLERGEDEEGGGVAGGEEEAL